MRKPLFLNALVAAVLFVACSPEEQLTIDLDFNNKDKVFRRDL